MRRLSLALLLFCGLFSFVAPLGCDREASVLFNLRGEREVFIELCCECLVNTDPKTLFPDGGVNDDQFTDEEKAAIAEGQEQGYLDDTCYVHSVKEIPATVDLCHALLTRPMAGVGSSR